MRINQIKNFPHKLLVSLELLSYSFYTLFAEIIKKSPELGDDFKRLKSDGRRRKSQQNKEKLDGIFESNFSLDSH